MAKRISDVTDHLYDQLARLSDDTLTVEDVDLEVKRAGAIVALADQITDSAKVQLSAAKLFAQHGAVVVPHLPLIGGSKDAG